MTDTMPPPPASTLPPDAASEVAQTSADAASAVSGAPALFAPNPVTIGQAQIVPTESYAPPPQRVLLTPEQALAAPPPRPTAFTAAQYVAQGWEPNGAAVKAMSDAKAVADYDLQFGPPAPPPPPPQQQVAETPAQATPSTTLIVPAFAQLGDVVKLVDGVGIEAPTPFYVVSAPVVDAVRKLVRADLSATKGGPAMLHVVLLNAGQARFLTPEDVAPLPDAAPAQAAAQAVPAINAPGSVVAPVTAGSASIAENAKRVLAGLSGVPPKAAQNTPGAPTPPTPVVAAPTAAVAGSTAPAVAVHGRPGPTPPAALPIGSMVTVPGGVSAASYCSPFCKEPWPHVHGKCPPACRDNHQHVTYDRKNPEPPAGGAAQ